MLASFLASFHRLSATLVENGRARRARVIWSEAGDDDLKVEVEIVLVETEAVRGAERRTAEKER